MGPIEQSWIVQEANCLRFKNLVYVQTFKAASTYYVSTLQRNGWQKTDLNSVDWANDKVFGFIMDPVQRYLKALTEDAYNKPMISIVNSVLQCTPQHVCLLTLHALPLSLVLGDLIYHIHWIPIDTDLDPDDALVALCSLHDVQIDLYPEFRNSNKSDRYKRAMFERIRSDFASGNAHFFRIFSKDLDLYRNVCDKSRLSSLNAANHML